MVCTSLLQHHIGMTKHKNGEKGKCPSLRFFHHWFCVTAIKSIGNFSNFFNHFFVKMSISLESVGSLQLQLGISSAFINIIQFDFRGSVVNSRKTDFDEHIFSSAENKHTNKKVQQFDLFTCRENINIRLHCFSSHNT